MAGVGFEEAALVDELDSMVARIHEGHVVAEQAQAVGVAGIEEDGVALARPGRGEVYWWQSVSMHNEMLY